MNLRDTLRRGEVDDGDGEVVETASRRMERLRRRAFDYDTRPGLVAATRALRRRLPGDDRYGDPLSTAGTQPVHLVGRQVSALQPDRDSVARELGLGALQVWQSVSEASGRGRGQRPLAILFTDLVGFSTWRWRQVTRRWSRCCAKPATAWRGRWPGTRGPSSSAWATG